MCRSSTTEPTRTSKRTSLRCRQQTHARLKGLSDTDPAGLLQVSIDVDPDYTEGSDLTYLHGVAITETTPVPEDLDAIEVPAGTWAVFHTEGEYPTVSAVHMGCHRHRLVPVQPVAAPPGTLDRGSPRSRFGLQHGQL